MSNGINELSKLDFDGKHWITELRNKLCKDGILTDQDIESAFDKVHSQIKLTDQILPVTEISNELKNKLTLHRLYGNTNVGGLYDNREIEFSPQLTVIYGKNGSGKSSFYRLLKDAFHSRQKLIGNIYNANTKPTSAHIDFANKNAHLSWQKKGALLKADTDISTVTWTGGTQFKFPVKFCDSVVLADSLSKKNTGWSLDRYKLGYYDKLRLAVESVEFKVSDRVSELNQGFAKQFDSFIKSFKATGENSFKDSMLFYKSNPNELLKLLKNLAEIRLDKDHEELKKTHGQKANAVFANYTQSIELLKSRQVQCETLLQFIDQKIELFLALPDQHQKIKTLKELKKSLDFEMFNPYELLFNPSSDPDKYIELIKKIAESALLFGYNQYPESIDKCFYCNQKLSQESKVLIRDIHELINSEVNKEINVIENDLNKFIYSLDKITSRLISTYQISEVELWNVKSKKLIQMDKVVAACVKNDELQTILNELKMHNDQFTSVDKYLGAFNILKDVLATESLILSEKISCASIDLSTLEKDRNSAKHNLNILEDKEYCIQQKMPITSMIEILEDVFKYEKVQSQFSSQKMKLSKDKGRVEDELIRKNYLLSFNKHLADFGFKKREKITRPFSTPSGFSKVDSKIQSNGNLFEINAILSEGEAKVYSLCDWLTELEYDESEVLIFDDPITSLDQVNTDKVVKKIVSLSSSYQIVVFTHNLEFYHRLVQKSLGSGQLHNAKCEICSAENEKHQCRGHLTSTGNTHKCCSYYQIEYILQPGEVVKDVMFLSLNWEQRMALLRKNLLAGNIREADKHLRTSINNFFERYVLADIKRSVYNNNDLIKEYRRIREIDMKDYDTLMEVHNKVSSEGTLHEPSPEVRTPLDVQGYIDEFNKAALAINNIQQYKKPNKVKDVIERIEIT